MNFSQITPYLFATYPGLPEQTFWYTLGGIVLVHIILGVFAILFRRSHDGYLKKLGKKLLFWSIISLIVVLVLASFRYQNIYALSTRAFLIAWLVIALAWLGNIGIWWLRHVPAARQRRQERQEYDKYLPRKK